MPKVPSRTKGEDEEERLDRELIELLNELRVVIPGVQVLFAFLLVVPFQVKFETLSSLQEDLYFATLLFAALATALLISPSAYHRALFRAGEKPRIIEYGHRLAIAGTACLMFAMTGAVTLICDLIFGSTRAIITGVLMLIVYSWFWFATGQIRRYKSSQ